MTKHPANPREVQICCTCDGLGSISEQQSLWLKAGADLKQFRIEHGLHLKDFAGMLHIKECDLTDMEYGRKQPISMDELLVIL